MIISSVERMIKIDGSYSLTDEENAIMSEWLAFSDLEKQAVLSLIETFKILKTAK